MTYIQHVQGTLTVNNKKRNNQIKMGKEYLNWPLQKKIYEWKWECKKDGQHYQFLGYLGLQSHFFIYPSEKKRSSQKELYMKVYSSFFHNGLDGHHIKVH